MHNYGLLAKKFVFNLQINKNLTFDRATVQHGLVLSNIRLSAGKQAARSIDINENLTPHLYCHVMATFVMVYFPSCFSR